MPLTTVEARSNDPGERAYLDALESYAADLDVSVASRTATVDGDRIHYLEAGDGPPLLCLHGISTSAATWLPLFEALAEEFRVVAPDRPGRGLSEPTEYADVDFREYGVAYVTGLMDALDVDSTRLLGSSLGGMQSLHLQVDHPERVDRTCLVGAPGGLSRKIPWLFRLTYVPKIGPWLFRRNVADSVDEAREGWQQVNLEDDSALSDALLEVELAAENVPGNTDSLVSLNYHAGTLRGGMLEKFIVRDELASSAVPTRFVWGTEDFFWPPSVGRPVVASMPNADMIALTDHGHTPWLEPTTKARDAVLEFLVD
ncbi:alpha/beta hydrolase [Halorubellus sp. JP-L1]|uniref:alpha/beta fold hydrolase n=1 Tax=Halorubellus sp. JP-L1 TaxID=2715753 RepID=UPI00140A0796|nr:alpha/beta hydrolase [Halorubellus sp. JP-L1]NHN41886.1 alpha/beta hydrolase [Halorubellus sp. JP-L1]